MHDDQESELKFIFEPTDLPKIKALPLLKDALPQANYQRLVSTYFDTPDRYLWKHGVSLRVRQSEQGLVQTLKATKVFRIRPGRVGGEGQPELARHRCS